MFTRVGKPVGKRVLTVKGGNAWEGRLVYTNGPPFINVSGISRAKDSPIQGSRRLATFLEVRYRCGFSFCGRLVRAAVGTWDSVEFSGREDATARDNRMRVLDLFGQTISS